MVGIGFERDASAAVLELDGNSGTVVVSFRLAANSQVIIDSTYHYRVDVWDEVWLIVLLIGHRRVLVIELR